MMQLSRRDQIVELRHAIAYLRWRCRDRDESPKILVDAEDELERLQAEERALRGFLALCNTDSGKLSHEPSHNPSY